VNPQQNLRTDFEQRLLVQLQAVVAERGVAEAGPEATAVTPARRRGPRLALGAAAGLAAVAAALIVSAGGDSTPAAYAVEPQDNGGVNVKIYSLSDASGLEHALDEAGIPSQVTELPVGMTCREPHYQPSTVTLPTRAGGQPFGGLDMEGPDEPMTIAITPESPRSLTDLPPSAELNTLPISPDEFGPDQTLILSGSPALPGGDGTEGGSLQVRIAEGTVGPCEPVPASDGPAPVRAPAGG